jgi:hypothetical protein
LSLYYDRALAKISSKPTLLETAMWHEPGRKISQPCWFGGQQQNDAADTSLADFSLA